MNSLAMPNVQGGTFILDEKVLKDLIEQSRTSPRKRMLLPMHRSQDAAVQRMLNCIQPGSYVRPHMHPQKHQIETISVIRGEFLFLVFDDFGVPFVAQRMKEGAMPCVADIEPRIWHAFWALKPDSVLLEIKSGPYIAEQDKVFAPWAPDENDEDEVEAFYARHINTIIS